MTPWTTGLQPPLSIEFSRQEYWSGLPCAPAGDLSNPRIEPGSPALQADSLPSEPQGSPSVSTERNLVGNSTGLNTCVRSLCEKRASLPENGRSSRYELDVGTQTQTCK